MNENMGLEFTTGSLIVGLIASSVGLAFFLYGKKQTRPPQLVAGIILMALPVVLPDALWSSVCAAAIVGGLWLAVRAGW